MKGKKMTVQPDGDPIRKAVKWISEQRESGSQKKSEELVNAAGIKFDLSPKDVDFLGRFSQGDKIGEEKK